MLGLVPAEDLNLETGWGKCRECQELFSLAPIVAALPEPIPERPINARTLMENSGGELQIDAPAQGMRAGTCGLAFFAMFWTAFIAFWTAGALGVLGGAKPRAFNLLFASFSIPFWLVGIGMLYAVGWAVWGSFTVRFDRQGMWTVRRCLAWSRSRFVELEYVQLARPFQATVKASGVTKPHAVEIVYQGGSFTIPTDSEPEVLWLVAVINSFLKGASAG